MCWLFDKFSNCLLDRVCRATLCMVFIDYVAGMILGISHTFGSKHVHVCQMNCYIVKFTPRFFIGIQRAFASCISSCTRTLWLDELFSIAYCSILCDFSLIKTPRLHYAHAWTWTKISHSCRGSRNKLHCILIWKVYQFLLLKEMFIIRNIF